MLNKRKTEKSTSSTTTLKLEHYFPTEKPSKTFTYNTITSLPLNHGESYKSLNLNHSDKEINKNNDLPKNNKNDHNFDNKLCTNQSESLNVENPFSKDSSRKRLETQSVKYNSNKKNEKASKMTKFFVKVKRANLLNDDIEFNSTNSNSNTSSEVINKMNSDQYINAIKNLNFVAFERKLGQTKSNIIGEPSNNSNFSSKIQLEERRNDSTTINENSFHSINNSSNIKILNEGDGGSDLLRHSKNYKMKEVPSTFEGVLCRINGQQMFSQKLNRKRQRFSSMEKLNEDEEEKNKNLNHYEIQKIFMDSFNQNSKSILEYNSDYDNFDSMRMPFKEKDYYNSETILDSNHFLNDNEENELKFL
jgi:hypothetical protein